MGNFWLDRIDCETAAERLYHEVYVGKHYDDPNLIVVDAITFLKTIGLLRFLDQLNIVFTQTHPTSPTKWWVVSVKPVPLI